MPKYRLYKYLRHLDNKYTAEYIKLHGELAIKPNSGERFVSYTCTVHISYGFNSVN